MQIISNNKNSENNKICPILYRDKYYNPYPNILEIIVKFLVSKRLTLKTKTKQKKDTFGPRNPKQK